MNRRYGWKRQLPDHRDQLYKPEVLSLPSFVKLGNLPPIKDQGDLGSCTAHGITSCVEYLELKDKHPLTLLSRLFLYYNERRLEGTVNSDTGANIRDGIKALKKWGDCSEKICQYDTKQFAHKPHPICYQQAIKHDLVKYSAINNLNGMKSCLAAGFPFVLGFSVYDSFESDEVAASGIVPMPSPDESCLGGHCVYCCGYTDAGEMFTCANSWGTSWGQQGFFQIPYNYLANPNLASDFWTIGKTRAE